jgi:hypothetical protein
VSPSSLYIGGVHLDFERYTIDLNAKCTCGCMEGKRIHKIYRFPNDYGASVVASPKLGSFKQGGFRVLVIHFESGPPENEYCVDRTTTITSDTLECNDWNAVEDGLVSIFALPRHNG